MVDYRKLTSVDLTPLPKEQQNVAFLSPHEDTLREKSQDWMANNIFQPMGFGPQSAYDKAGTTQNILDFTPFGAASSAEDATRAFREGNYGEGVLNTAGTAADVLPGAHAIFGGITAAKADWNMLNKAHDMLAQGRDMNDIRQSTGWFNAKPIGGDPDWKFEIPDSGFMIKENIGDQLIGGPPTTITDKFGQLFQHPELLENYPQFEHLPVNLTTTNQQRGGFFTPPGHKLAKSPLGDISAEAPTVLGQKGLEGITLHELQHATQNAEGFARGSNPEFEAATKEGLHGRYALAALMAKEASRVGNMSAKDAAQRIIDMGGYDVTDAPMLLAWMNQAPEVLERFAKENTAHRLYERQAGEVEARNVQRRLDYSQSERADIAPWESQDVPYSNQRVRR
jgi:hypothetical protein